MCWACKRAVGQAVVDPKECCMLREAERGTGRKCSDGVTTLSTGECYVVMDKNADVIFEGERVPKYNSAGEKVGTKLNPKLEDPG